MSSQGAQSSSLPGALSSLDRSQRSVFVGNISYEATEDELKEIFSQVGPVIHFRLVTDRESGKPKGYGFCEYVDQEMAGSAIRNLNGFEFHGRPLRVDSAAGSDRNKEEVRQLQMTLGGPAEESPFGPPCDTQKAPENISRAVASLPPEQMFELMKQMKLCIQNNPNEAKNMLLQNPQLAYALLQAQVVMRIVDPQVAITMLHRETATAPVPFPPPQPPVSMAAGRGMMMGPPGPGFVGGGPPRSMYGGDVDLRQMPFDRPPVSQPPPTSFAPSVSAASLPPSSRAGGPGPSQPVTSDNERAALILQVLQLTDAQINLLPEEQKHGVLKLREELKNANQL